MCDTQGGYPRLGDPVADARIVRATALVATLLTAWINPHWLRWSGGFAPCTPNNLHVHVLHNSTT